MTATYYEVKAGISGIIDRGRRDFRRHDGDNGEYYDEYSVRSGRGTLLIRTLLTRSGVRVGDVTMSEVGAPLPFLCRMFEVASAKVIQPPEDTNAQIWLPEHYYNLQVPEIMGTTEPSVEMGWRAIARQMHPDDADMDTIRDRYQMLGKSLGSLMQRVMFYGSESVSGTSPLSIA